MQKWIKSLEDPDKVAAIQNFFGVAYNKRISPKTVAENEQENELNNKILRKGGSHTSNITDDTTSNDIRNKIETGKGNGHDDDGTKNYTVKNKFWYYIFLGGTYLGDVAGYAIVIPFWFWNVDVVIGRKIVLVWTVIMYIGQALKEMACRERPPCPPVIRLQKKWSEEYGMPSTHAMVGVAFPSSIIYYGARSYKVSCEYGIITALLWCTLISFSRLYLGMHSILDVLAGLLLSSLLLIIFLPIMDTVGTALVHDAWIPFAIIALSIILIALYPKSHGPLNTSTRGDTTSILATCTGIQIACWLNYEKKNMENTEMLLPHDITVPNWKDLGDGALRTIVGLICIFFSLLLFDVLLKATYWMFNRLKNSVHSVNNTKIPIVELFFKYLTFGISSFHVVFSIPILFNYLNINRSTYYMEPRADLRRDFGG